MAGDEVLQVLEEGFESAHSWLLCLPVHSGPNVWGAFYPMVKTVAMVGGSSVPKARVPGAWSLGGGGGEVR